MAKRASSKRFAQALFELSLQRDQLEPWAADLKQVSEALDHVELRSFLEHAKIPLQRKVETIKQAFQDTDPIIQNLLCLLVSRGIIDLAPEVEQVFQQLLNEHEGREEVEVHSAVPLETSEEERIGRFLADLIKKEIVLSSSVEPSMLGGLVIRVGDKLIDGSTRTKLEELGKRLQRDTSVIGV